MFLPGGIIGVAIFFIIAGYFGIQSNKVKVTNIIYKTVSYSLAGLIIWLILTILNVLPSNIGIRGFFECFTKGFFPCASSAYWFITIYILIMLCKSIINEYFRKLSDSQLVGMFMLLLFIYACLRAISGSMLELYQGMTYYFIGVMLYRFRDRLEGRNFVFVLLATIGWFGYVIFEISNIGGQISGLIATVIMGTISAFGFSAFFVYKKEFQNRIINKIGISTLAVYLIHENPLLREGLWSKLLHVETFQVKSLLFPLWAFLSIFSIFIVSVVIDLVKTETIDKVLRKR